MIQSGKLATAKRRPGDFVLNMLHFARQLKERGLPVTPGRTLDALRGLKLISLDDKQEAHTLLSAHYVTQPEELAVFDSVFEEFWCGGDTHTSPDSSGHIKLNGTLPLAVPGETGKTVDQLRHDFETPP